jgi:hypothetical protein
MRTLRAKPGPLPLKVADYLWPNLTMRVQDAMTKSRVNFFLWLDRRFSRNRRSL